MKPSKSSPTGDSPISKPPTPYEFKERIRAILYLYENDEAELHKAADEHLCETLILLGYEEGIRLYNKMEKWYE